MSGVAPRHGSSSRLSGASAFLLCALCAIKAGHAADVAQELDNIRQQHNIAAAAFLVVSPTARLDEAALGVTNWDTGEKFTLDHLIRIGSISKTVTALTVMRLVESGALELEDPIAEFLPPGLFENPWRETRPLRVAHLLEHTGGLHDLNRAEFDFNEPVDLARAFAVAPRSRVLRWPPGLHSSYSNTGAGLVSRALESVADSPFEAIVQTEVFGPLGMSSAGFSVADTVPQRLITGYDRDGRTPIPYWHTLYRAFGGVNVSVKDMGVFVQLFLRRGDHPGRVFLRPASIERMETPRTSLAAKSGLQYGYGLGIYQFQRRGYSFFGHGGDADGYLTFFAYAPKLERGYFVVINAYKQSALNAMRKVIEADILAERAAPDALPVPPLSRQQLRLVGAYAPVTQRFSRSKPSTNLEVLAQDGRLYTRFVDQSRQQEIVPVTAWHFRRPQQRVATIAFIPCAETIYIQGDLGNYAKVADGNLPSRCAEQPPPTRSD